MEPALQRALDDARLGKLPAAIASVRRYLSIKPTSLEGLQVLALLLTQSGQHELAAASLSRAVELSPGSAPIRNNYANILIHLRRFSDAAAQARRAIELNPSYSNAYLALSSALLHAADSPGAILAARRGLELAPDSAEHARNLIVALDQAGHTEEALSAAELAHRRHPGSPELHSMFLMHLNYTDRADITTEHLRFNQSHPPAPRTRPIDPLPERPLRIGFLSSDLRTHSVAYFLEPLFEHAPPWAEVICFSLAPALTDPVAKRLRNRSAAWEEVGHLGDAELTARIRAARIDLLIDLMGHTGGNRLPVLASRPASVIVTAIGYPNTTGLAAVDYRLVDPITDPPGTESQCSERLLRISPCFLCYRPPENAPKPQLPSPTSPITFGSFNASSKIGGRTAALWRDVLHAVPGSRLLLKSKELGEAIARDAVLDRLTNAGIDRDRIEFLPAAPTIAEHLSLYSRIHVALDPTPYNGTTTTCEALFMGVPVVSLEGDRHVARVGSSLLRAAGHSEWVASTPEDYIRIATALAGDPVRLEAIRTGLRSALAASALCDAGAYAARVFEAFRSCWKSALG